MGGPDRGLVASTLRQSQFRDANAASEEQPDDEADHVTNWVKTLSNMSKATATPNIPALATEGG